MGKLQQQNLRQQQRDGIGSSSLFCERCSMGISRIYKEFSFKCVFVLILCLCLFVSGIFYIIPFHSSNSNGFDAKDAIKLRATVQAYFRLERPVSHLVPRIGQLEYDINGEIGVPDAKVAVLSMHQNGASNWTDVVFGVLFDPINDPMDPVFLSLLKSSLIELFLHQSNLTLTTSIFGQPCMFDILEFPGGISIIPPEFHYIWDMPQNLFNFTLNNSISEILGNFTELRDQLNFGLHLGSFENLFLLLTNTNGSTIDPPVIIQASIISELGSIKPQRMKQLAQTITDSPGKNLGLDNSVFGKVKSVILSSYLQGTLHVTPPTPSPAPSPDPCSNHGSPTPSPSPSHSNPMLHSHSVGSPSRLPRELSLASRSEEDSTLPSLAPSPLAPSPSSLAMSSFHCKTWLLGCLGILSFLVLCWPH